MDSGKILVLKKVNLGDHPPSASTPVLMDKGSSPAKGSPAGKENSPQPPTRGVGRVREAALALERLAKQKRDSERGNGQSFIQSEVKAVAAGSTSGPNATAPSVVPNAAESVPKSANRAVTSSGATDSGTDSKAVGSGHTQVSEAQEGNNGRQLPVQGEKAAEPAVDNPVSSGHRTVTQKPEGDEISKPPVQPKTAAVLVGESATVKTAPPWGLSMLRSTSAKTGPSKEKGEEGGVAVAGSSGGGSKGSEGGARMSVKSLMQMWNRQEGNAAATSAAPKTATATESTPVPPPQPATMSPRQSSTLTSLGALVGMSVEADTSAQSPTKDGAPPRGPPKQNEACPPTLSGSDSCVAASNAPKPLGDNSRSDTPPETTASGGAEQGPQALQLEGGLLVGTPIIVEVVPSPPELSGESACGTPPKELEKRDQASVTAAGGQAGSAKPGASFSTPPGVAGVFFRPKKKAWRPSLVDPLTTKGPHSPAQKKERETALGAASKPLAPEKEPAALAGESLSTALDAPMETEGVPAVASSPQRVLKTPDLDAGACSGTKPKAVYSPLRPRTPLHVAPLASELHADGSSGPESEPTSPPPTTAAAQSPSPASLKQGASPALLVAPLERKGSPVAALQVGVSSATRANGSTCEEPNLEVASEAVTPTVQRTLSSAATFFSPRLLGRERASETDVVTGPSPARRALEFGAPLLEQAVCSALVPPDDSKPEVAGEAKGVEPTKALPLKGPDALASPRLSSASAFFSPQAARKASGLEVIRSPFATQRNSNGRGEVSNAEGKGDCSSGDTVEADDLGSAGKVGQADPQPQQLAEALQSASSFFSPQARRAPSMPAAARSLFTSGETVHRRGLKAAKLETGEESATALVSEEVAEIANQGPQEPAEKSAERFASPPPSAAATFFSPRKVKPLSVVSEPISSGLRRGGLSSPEPVVGVNLVAPQAMFQVKTPSADSGEKDNSGGAIQGVDSSSHRVSPPPPSAAGFFSPSKPALSRAFPRVDTRPSFPNYLLKEPVSEQAADAEIFLDADAEATPYASANCSPMSLPASTPRSSGVGPSRKVWELLGDDLTSQLEATSRRGFATSPVAEKLPANVGGWQLKARESSQQGGDTWQSDVECVQTDATEKRSELGSSHVLDWESPDHLKVRTPPFRSGWGGLGQLTGHSAGGADWGNGGSAALSIVENAAAEANVGEQFAPAAEAVESLLQKTSQGREAGNSPVETTPSALFSADWAHSFSSPSQEFEPPVDPIVPAQQTVGVEAEPAAAATPALSHPQPTTSPGRLTSVSPSKPGLWSSFVGGIRGIITPPQPTPPQSDVKPFEEREHLDRGTRENWREAAFSAEGRRHVTTVESSAHASLLADPYPGGYSATQEEPRVESPGLPPGSFKRQKSASPRTPPLASRSYASASMAAKTFNPPRYDPPTYHPTLGSSVPTSESAEAPPLHKTAESPDEKQVEFSPWETVQVAAIFEHFEKNQLGAKAFFSARGKAPGEGAYLTSAQGDTGQLATEASVADNPSRRQSFESADSCFDLGSEKVFQGVSVDDVADPIVRAVSGLPAGDIPLVNYYDVAKMDRSEEEGREDGKLPMRFPVAGEIPLHKAGRGVYTRMRLGATSAYPHVKDPSPLLTRWLNTDRAEEASFWAPSSKPEPVPNWARGTAVGDGAFVGRKTGDPFAANPDVSAAQLRNISGDQEASRPAQGSLKRTASAVPASVRTRKGPVPIDQVKRREDPNKKYFPARVNELRDSRGGDSPAKTEREDRDLFRAPAGAPNPVGLTKRGRSMSVTDRAQSQRKSIKEGFASFRSLTPHRFRSPKTGDAQTAHERPNPSPSRTGYSDVPRGSPARPRLGFSRAANAAAAAPFEQRPAAVPFAEDKENHDDVGNRKPDVSKFGDAVSKSGSDVSTGGQSEMQADGPASVPDTAVRFDRVLSLRDPNREPTLNTEYVEVPATDERSAAVAAAEAAALWEPTVSEVDPPSAWAHLTQAALVGSPLPSDVSVCRCYVVREQPSKTSVTATYKLFTEEGEGRADRLLLVARHQRHLGRSEFVIADSSEQLSDTAALRCLVRANFVGSKYTAYSAEPEGKGNEGHKLVEIGYATTATSLAPTFRRMLVALAPADGAAAEQLTLVSKPPVYNKEQKRFEINYGGRSKDGAGIQQSVKNFQLVRESAVTRTLLLFGKVGKDVFAMDYRAPFTALQAFAICLSSIDSKLCCAL